MKTLGMLEAMKLCRDYKGLPPEGRKELRKERLRALLAHARANSPYYARLYAHLPEEPALADLPPVNKRELMDHWDDWVTDPAVTLEQIKAFMEDKDNIGRRWQGKYMVVTTSGSTGDPLVLLLDRTAEHVLSAVSAQRSYARKEDLRSFALRGGKSMGVYADSGFYLGNSTIRSKLLMMPWKKRQFGLSSALRPVEEIVAELNAFRPAMLGGYPSNLELLIDEQKSGRLHISPVLIMTGGEYLSDSLREALAQTFHYYVQTSYACTEGGTVACECRERHLHLNDDWLLVEPVDRLGRPVEDGELADKYLLTNLYNYTQPLIRYEVTDRIVLQGEGCPCGDPSPWIEVEGRNDDVLTFEKGDGTLCRVPPLAIYAQLKEVEALRRFQLVSRRGNRLELRLEPMPDVTREEAFAKADQALEELLAGYGVERVDLSLSEDLPRQHPVSGKFKHIIREDGQGAEDRAAPVE